MPTPLFAVPYAAPRLPRVAHVSAESPVKLLSPRTMRGTWDDFSVSLNPWTVSHITPNFIASFHDSGFNSSSKGRRETHQGEDDSLPPRSFNKLWLRQRLHLRERDGSSVSAGVSALPPPRRLAPRERGTKLSNRARRRYRDIVKGQNSNCRKGRVLGK